MSEPLALYLLGPPKLELNQAPVVIDRRKTLALLVYLAVNRWRHQRDQISALLWPDHDQGKAFTNLRHELWEVRQVLGDGWIDSGRDTIGWNNQAGIWLDVAEFERMISQNSIHKNLALRIPPLTSAVKLYRDHFLSGFNLRHTPGFNEWALNQSENLRQQLAQALMWLADDLCSFGQAEAAIPHALRLIRLDPLNETSHRQLMQIYVEAGQPAAALRQYRTCEKILRKELGIDPQPETRALYRQIRK